MYYRMPRKVLRATMLLCFFAAVFGLWLGGRNLPSEADVVAAGAALYVAETGGQATDCIGVPGTGLVWVAVRCGRAPDTREFLFSRQGTLMAPDSEPQA